MDVVERMKQASATLSESSERMARAFAAIERDYARLRADSTRLCTTMAGLAGEVGAIETSLVAYDDRLGRLDEGVRGIGDKSRGLVRIMDDYLTTTRPRTRAA